ncbi:MAG: hypothetical protein IPF44_01915 [Betaproteobacteria bacterium]|nr:hypothetical protein [Betaproteobacteria bacterium]
MKPSDCLLTELILVKIVEDSESSSYRAFENSFEVVVRVVCQVFPNWADSHAVKIIRRLERDVFPGLALDRLLRSKRLSCRAQSKSQESRGVLKRLTVLQNRSQIFLRYAVRHWRSAEIHRPDLRGVSSSRQRTAFRGNY